jgi:aminopeptidase N
MQMISRIFPAAVLISLITACHSSKKASAAADQTLIKPSAVSSPENDPVKNEIYRGSNPRGNDIIHTKLEVNFDWKLCRMNGKATIQVKPYFYPTNMLYLNARGMDLKKVQVLDVPPDSQKQNSMGTVAESASKVFSYVYENDSIKINLGRTFLANENYTVVIDYVARPNELKSAGGSNAITDDKGLYFVNPTGENPFKMPQIWTQGETQSNSVWFPTIDSPNEKMTQEIYMTVDDKYTTLSNGLLISSTKQADGTRTDYWKLDQPHSPYLAMMAVGEFKKVVDTPWNGKEISYYVDKEYEADAKGIFGDTREMIEFYSNKLGVPYAWPKYAQIVARDYVSGAMENTSATLHGDFIVYQTTREMIDSKKGNSVIAHELFHQWFGDLATCESWSNLSLNESFATYGEYLWEEYKFGRDAADYHRWQSKQGYFASTKEVDIIRFNYNDKEDMFDAFSYNKGGLVLHMLRKAVGDEAFFASLKNYLETNKYKSAEIHNLRLAFEETTGKDMNWFFNQWYLNKGRPKLKVTKKYNATSDTLVLTLEQQQDLKKYPLYTLPMDVDLYVAGKVDRKHIVLTDQKQNFTFAIKGVPLLVNVDAERQLIADIEYPKTTGEYVFQYFKAELYEDRLEALKELESKMVEDEVFRLFKEAAEKDKFFAIRNYAIQKLELGGTARNEDIKGELVKIYATEKNTVTRAKALGALNKLFPGHPEMVGLNENALSEQSYAICGEAIQGLAKGNPKLAMEKASRFENESGKDVLFPIANLYATYGGDSQIQFFHSALRYINGFELMTFCASYVKTAKACKNPSNAITAAKDLEVLNKGASKYIKFTTSKGLKDLLSTWESRESTAQANLDSAKKEKKDTVELEKELKIIKETKSLLAGMYERSK